MPMWEVSSEHLVIDLRFGVQILIQECDVQIVENQGLRVQTRGQTTAAIVKDKLHFFVSAGKESTWDFNEGRQSGAREDFAAILTKV